MKVMCVSDLHGQLDSFKEAASEADVVLIAGDALQLKAKNVWGIFEQKAWAEKVFAPLLESLNAEVVLVPGNHDFVFDKDACKAKRILSSEMAVRWPKNVHVLNGHEAVVKGLRVWGCAIVPFIDGTWAFEGTHEMLDRAFSKMPEGLDFAVVHSPPFISRDCNIDVSLDGWDPMRHFGAYELSDAVLHAKPKKLVCGHIHTGSHNRHLLGETECWNVSRLNEDYEPAFKPLMLDIDVEESNG